VTDDELADQLLRARDASACSLYSVGPVAQIEEVATLLAHRNRGLARAVVLASLESAVTAGAELVFLAADDLDWPKELYACLGFDPLGTVEAFTRPPPADRQRERNH
jgi:predicted GNAT family acetyltransferase